MTEETQENTSLEEVEDDIEELLIESVRETPQLWNHTSDAYKNRQLKIAGWKSVSKAIGKPELWCKCEWKKLRDSYTRKKKALIGKTGQAQKKIELSGHYLLLSFLNDVPSIANTTGNLSELNDSNDLDDVEEDAQLNDSMEDHSETFSTSKSADPKVLPAKNTSYSATRNRKRAQDPIEKELMEIIKHPRSSEDEHHHFGMSIADQMRKMDPGFAQFVKMNIQRVIYECMYPPRPVNTNANNTTC